MPEIAKDLAAWIGRAETITDIATSVPARALAATLDCEQTIADGDALPLPWHWLYGMPLDDGGGDSYFGPLTRRARSLCKHPRPSHE